MPLAAGGPSTPDHRVLRSLATPLIGQFDPAFTQVMDEVMQLARQIFAWGRPIPLDELVGRIESVTPESARAAGRALIGRGRPAIAALGPGPGLESAATIAESLVRKVA